MKITIGQSSSMDTHDAIDECLTDLNIQNTQLIVVNCTELHDVEVIVDELRSKCPDSEIVGHTICAGVMGRDGFCGKDGWALSISAFEMIGAESCRTELINYDNADDWIRFQENKRTRNPNLIWLCSSPGSEESTLSKLEETFDDHIPVYGGSCADNNISGNWKLFSNDTTISNGALLICFYSTLGSSPKSCFSSAYNPTGESARVTKAIDRRLIELDGEAAINTYNKWTESQYGAQGEQALLEESTLFPIARMLSDNQNMPFFQLSHPESVDEQGAINLFTELKVGDTIHLMSGTSRNIKMRLSQMSKEFLEENLIDINRITGAYVVFCAGCMLNIGEQGINEVSQTMKTILGEKPFLGLFTFGEQGSYLQDKNIHGNLMISLTLFF